MSTETAKGRSHCSPRGLDGGRGRCLDSGGPLLPFRCSWKNPRGHSVRRIWTLRRDSMAIREGAEQRNLHWLETRRPPRLMRKIDGGGVIGWGEQRTILTPALSCLRKEAEEGNDYDGRDGWSHLKSDGNQRTDQRRREGGKDHLPKREWNLRIAVLLLCSFGGLCVKLRNHVDWGTLGKEMSMIEERKEIKRESHQIQMKIHTDPRWNPAVYREKLKHMSKN